MREKNIQKMGKTQIFFPTFVVIVCILSVIYLIFLHVQASNRADVAKYVHLISIIFLLEWRQMFAITTDIEPYQMIFFLGDWVDYI